ncbi:MAG: sulfatase [Nitrospirae bacterium]|nr:sulfatase [Nitrospirota bacterium]
MRNTLVVMAVAAAIGACWFTYNNTRLWGLYKAVKASDNKASIGLYNPWAALSRLPQSRLNGYVYRFDDRLGEARVEGAGRGVPERYRTRVIVGHGVCLLRLNKGSLARSGDGVRAVFTAGQFLFNSVEKDPLKIRIADLASIVIRARHARGAKMSLYLNQDVEHGDFKDAIVIDVVADGKFHDYVVDRDKLPHGQEFLDGLAVKPSNVEGDDVEIASVSAVSAKEGFLKKTAGVASHALGGDHRPCLFMRGGTTLRYGVDTRGGKDLSLRFGLASLYGSGPVYCSIDLVDGGGVRTIFKRTAAPADGWRDVSIPFPETDGRAEVVIRTSGDRDGVVFFGNPALSGPPAKRMSVIWYVEDAETADHLSVYGYGRETTPFKEEFARKGALFENAYSQATKTGISCTSFFTGLYPAAEGVWDNNSAGLSPEFITLASILRSQGFETASFIQNYFAGPALGLDRGFCTVHTVVGEPAPATVKRVHAWIDGHQDRNLFVYVHIFNPHAPYDPAAPYDAWFREAPGATSVIRDDGIDPAHVAAPTVEGRTALYDGEIRANDAVFERFVSGLGKSGVLDDTLLIFSSDHGEYLGEKGLWEHRPPCLGPVLHVPLIMVYPGRIKPGRFGQNVQLLDVMPTVLDYAGIDSKRFQLCGDSLAGLVDGKDPKFWDERLTFADEVSTRKGKSDRDARGAAIYKGYLYTVKPGANGKAEWLSVDGSDSLEPEGITGRAAAMLLSGALEGMQGRSLGIWDGAVKGRETEKKEDLAARDKLKALGYLH